MYGTRPHWYDCLTRDALTLRYEHGVNAFDTANVYSNGLSEVYLGNAIKALNLPREEIVVMTKVSGRQSAFNTFNIDVRTMLITTLSYSEPSVKKVIHQRGHHLVVSLTSWDS